MRYLDDILMAFRLFPDQTAVSYFDQIQKKQVRLTFREIDRICGELYEIFRKSEQNAIGILTQKTETSYAAMVSCWALGISFVPLNPRWPVEKTATIIAEADLKFVIFDRVGKSVAQDLLARKWSHPPQFAEFNFQGPAKEKSRAKLTDLLTAEIGFMPLSLAYIIFTSGTTGVPKGIPVSQFNLQTYYENIQGLYDINPSDRIAQVFELSFDPSIGDLLWAWTKGACLCPFTSFDMVNIIDFVGRERVTIWNSSPSMARLCLSIRTILDGSFGNIRLTTFIGESLSLSLVREWHRIAPISRIENLYGPAETTISVMRKIVDLKQVESISVPISKALPQDFAEDQSFLMISLGKPYANVQIDLRDQEGCKVMPGEVGEIWIGGSQVVRGYLKKSELSKDKFFELDQVRWFKTGDLARCLDNGEYFFVGRSDLQVKVAGQRVCLEEVETHFSRALDGQEVVVLPGQKDIDGHVISLLAVVFRPITQLQKEAAILECAKHLAGTLVPKQVHIVFERPINANGKLDRVALAKKLRLESID